MLKLTSSRTAVDREVSLESSASQLSSSKPCLVTWVCAFCTSENLHIAEAQVCDACGKTRDAAANRNEGLVEEGGVEELGVFLACIKCNFHNEPHAKACAMCQVVPGLSDGNRAPELSADRGDNVDNWDKHLQSVECGAEKVCETCLGLGNCLANTQLDAAGGGGIEHSEPEKDSMGQAKSHNGEGVADPDGEHKVQDQHVGIEGRQPGTIGDETLESEEQNAPGKC